jgi:hypothetical protein
MTYANGFFRMRQKIEKLKRTSFLAANNNPRAAPIMASPPTLTSTSSVTSGNTHDYLLYTGWDPATMRTNHEFDMRGGEPYLNTGNGQVTLYAGTVRTGATGNIDSTTKKASAYRWAFMTDATTVDIRVNGFSYYRVLVDLLDGTGLRYVSKTPHASPSAGGAQYLHIPFGSRQAKGRLVIIECQGPAGITSAHVKPTETIWKPSQADRTKVVVIGDSLGESTGAVFMGDGFSCVMGDYCGITDLRQCAIGGTGYVNPVSPSGIQWPYGSHSVDWTSLTDVDAIIFTGGNNDTDQTGSVQAAATSLIATTRNALQNTPIFVFGPDSFGTPVTNVLAVETALAAAVASFSSSTIQFIPLCVLADGGESELTGTGNVNATVGDGNADFYTGNANPGGDNIHPDEAGHEYRGMRRAALFRKHLFMM